MFSDLGLQVSDFGLQADQTKVELSRPWLRMNWATAFYFLVGHFWVLWLQYRKQKIAIQCPSYCGYSLQYTRKFTYWFFSFHNPFLSLCVELSLMYVCLQPLSCSFWAVSGHFYPQPPREQAGAVSSSTSEWQTIAIGETPFWDEYGSADTVHASNRCLLQKPQGPLTSVTC